MGKHETVYIIEDLKGLQRYTNAFGTLNSIIRKAHKAEGCKGSPQDYYCNSQEEAISFFISLASDSPLSPEEQDIVFISWAMFEDYQNDENLTARRKHYLAEREEYDPSYIKGVPFRELDEKGQKDKADALNKTSAYSKISVFFNNQPNLMEYISSARKRYIKEVDGRYYVVLPTPSYKSSCNTCTDDVKQPSPETSAHDNADAEDIQGEMPGEAQIDAASPKRKIKPWVFCVVGFVVVIVILTALLRQKPAEQPDITPLESTSESYDLDQKLSNDITKLREDADYRAELQAGAEQNNMEDQFFLGASYYLRGEYDLAEHWFLAAANQNYAPAQSFLCLLYCQTGEKEGEIYEWAVKAADHHDSLGCFFLGRCYEEGIVVEPDRSKAASLYQCVIDGEDQNGQKLIEPLAQFHEAIAVGFAENALAVLYMNGDGIEQDYMKSLQLFKAAYDDGYIAAALHIGEFYYYGYGVDRDYEAAYLWYHRAAEDGNAEAMTVVGMFYYGGIHVNQNYSEAAAWFRKAIDQDEPNARFYLGYMYLNALGVEKDEEKGMTLIHQSAERGVDAAKAFLDNH